MLTTIGWNNGFNSYDSKGKANTKYKLSYVTVKHGTVCFDILSDRLRRFCI